MQLKLHLVFQGTCEQAFNLYKEAMRAEIICLLRNGENPDMSSSGSNNDQISYIVLKTKNFEIGGHDACSMEKINEGNNAKQVLAFSDRGELDRTFKLLSEGGKVVMPLEKVSFSDAFGEVVDRFGITWITMMEEKSHSM